MAVSACCCGNAAVNTVCTPLSSTLLSLLCVCLEVGLLRQMVVLSLLSFLGPPSVSHGSGTILPARQHCSSVRLVRILAHTPYFWLCEGSHPGRREVPVAAFQVEFNRVSDDIVVYRFFGLCCLTPHCPAFGRYSVVLRFSARFSVPFSPFSRGCRGTQEQAPTASTEQALWGWAGREGGRWGLWARARGQ